MIPILVAPLAVGASLVTPVSMPADREPSPVEPLSIRMMTPSEKERATTWCEDGFAPAATVEAKRVYSARWVRFRGQARRQIIGRGTATEPGAPTRRAWFLCSPAGGVWTEANPDVGPREVNDIYAYTGYAGRKGHRYAFVLMYAFTGRDVARLQVRFFTREHSTGWQSMPRDGKLAVAYGTANRRRYNPEKRPVWVTIRGVDRQRRPIRTIITRTRLDWYKQTSASPRLHLVR